MLSDIENESTSSKLVFPDFDEIKVSTKTFIVMTNMTLNIDKLFQILFFFFQAKKIPKLLKAIKILILLLLKGTIHKK